ncbi:MAG: FAD-dependent oxidoreductase [Acidobacteriota bacterium]|nr:FAD-dependent oxidoreductase [Acidobacteriota bacterium]
MITLTVAEIRKATPESRILRLELSEPFAYEPGQSAQIGLHGQPDRRHYSLATPPEMAASQGTLEFLIRVGRDGSIGPHLDGLHRGSLIDVEGPSGRFVFPSTPARRACLFIAGGTGIAPIRAMLLRAVTLPDLALGLAYSARASRDFAYLPELKTMRREAGLRMLLTATREAPESWPHDRGRLSQTRLSTLVDTPETLCFVCGPPALVEDVPRALMTLGIDEKRILTEIF